MKTEDFNNIIEDQLNRSKDVLCSKAAEYATDDRLHTFKVAAELQGCSTKKALAGMMAKHTVSIYNMCVSDKLNSTEMWNEKITDHINYLLLLRAIIEEDMVQSIATQVKPIVIPRGQLAEESCNPIYSNDFKTLKAYFEQNQKVAEDNKTFIEYMDAINELNKEAAYPKFATK